jgi:EAL domain-containing protein (putative c-di-GMP-specific phosphodiesterase class I)
MGPVNEVTWRLFAPLSVGGQTLLVEDQEEGSIRLGGSQGAVLQPRDAQELLLHLLTGESWVMPRLVWAAPHLQIGARTYTLNERARLALIETLQALLAEQPGLSPTNPTVQDSWQRALVELAQSSFPNPHTALTQLSQKALGLFGLEGLSLWLASPGTFELKLLWSYPHPKSDEVLSPKGAPEFFSLINRSLLISSDEVEGDFRLRELLPLLRRRRVAALLQVTLHSEGGPLGVLWLEAHQPRSWRPEDHMQALSLSQLLERQLRSFRLEAPREEEAIWTLPTNLGVSQSEFEAYLRQALALAQRHGRALALGQLYLEGIGPKEAERCLAILSQTLRQSDAVCFYAPNHIAVLLSELRQTSEAYRVGQRILRKLREGLTPEIHLALGLSVFPELAGSAEELWQQAETAAQKAREAGGGLRLLNPKAEELQALDQGSLTLHFQPILQLTDLKLAAVEALLRRPNLRTTQNASELLPLLQQTGFMKLQDQWGLERIAEQAARWQTLGTSLRFSLNLSEEALLDPSFPRMFQKILSNYLLSGERLILEVREESLAIDPTEVAKVLKALQASGAWIALDDFGIHPLPLAQLKRFPLHWIKLAPVLSQHEYQELARAAITLAHGIGALAVAKGLEEQSQLTRMRELGCDLGQGYLLGWPVPTEDLGALLSWRQP